MRTYGLPEYEADILVKELKLADYFEAVVFAAEHPSMIAVWHMLQFDDTTEVPIKYVSYFVEKYGEHIPTPTQCAKFIINEMMAAAKKYKKEVWEIPAPFTALLLLMRRAGTINNKKIQEMLKQEYEVKQPG